MALISAVFVWGYAGYCRLGLGNQKDALVAQPVPQVRLWYGIRQIVHLR